MAIDGRDAYPNPPDEFKEAFRRPARVGAGLGVVLFVLTILVLGIRPYAEYLWFAQDARQLSVWTMGYTWQSALFVPAMAIAVFYIFLNLNKALDQSFVFLGRAIQLPEQVSIKVIGYLQSKVGNFSRIVGLVIGILAAARFSEEWRAFLMFRNTVPFGKVDPVSGRDLSFLVFELPWWQALIGFFTFLTTLTAILVIGTYVAFQALASLAKAELARPQIRKHIGFVLCLTLISWAAGVYLQTFELGYVEGTQFTGAGFALANTLWARQVLAVILAICGVLCLFALNSRPFAAIGTAVAVPVVWILVFLAAVPAFQQRFVVDPNRLATESPYAERAIQMTRFAYGLDKIKSVDTTATPAPTAQQRAEATETLDNMRLWDPDVLRQALEGLQSFRSYYTFHDVDIDRYTIDGREQMVMIAPRDMNHRGLPPAAQNWTNLRLRYTHGYGVTISKVDAATPDGEPLFLAKDVPLNSPTIQIDEPRIYFSDFRDGVGFPEDEYAIVNTNEKEFDYETADGSVTHEWTGTRGIQMGSFPARLVHAILLRDVNILVSSNITAESRLLRRRNVLERAGAIYPFLKLDLDPYIVIHEGRLVWILDAYTTTDRIPYSQMVFGRNGKLNYIRNSVKIVIDAYTGEATAYANEPDEPILRVHQRIYPGLVQPMTNAPASLRKHFRYPEDAFTVQSQVLTQYHVTNPRVFLSNSDAWNVALERSLTGASTAIRPYYVQMQLPRGGGNGFFLIRPFTPTGKPNMSGWLAASGDEPTRGQLTLYRFRGELPPGPELMESKFNSDQEIANINRQFNNDQSEIVVGNSLVIPIGDSVMYAESLFLRSRTTGIQATPRLTKVILALRDKIVVRDTYQQAYEALFGANEPVGSTVPASDGGEPAAGTTPASGGTTVPRAEVSRALGILDQADAALRSGDFARYGQLQKQARDILRRLGGASQ